MTTTAPLPFPGFHSPAASAEAPLEMLSACHGRVERQCATLRKLQRHLPRHGADEQARQAATSVMRYFDTAARDHHADEEQDLFPALLESMAGSDAVCLRGLTDRLVAEHRALEARWAAMRQRLQAVAEGEADADTLPLAEVEAFVQAYTGHIATEETELLPMAQRLLDDDAIGRLGLAMRRRRGLDPLP